jgi:ClpP class serine protease
VLPEPLQNFKEEAERILSKFERLRGNAVSARAPLLYSWNRLIAKPDVDNVYDCLLQMGPQPKLDVIIFSRGGDPDQAYVIGNLLQSFTSEKLTIIVPRFAKSATTLIVCAGDEVAMGPASELGPIDLII